MSTKGCVYRIENTVNGRVYIGATIDLANRTRLHWLNLRQGYTIMHRKMVPDAVLHGPDKFIFKKLIVCTKEELHENEIMIINAYKMIMGDNMYNHTSRKHNTGCLWTKTSKKVLDSECFDTQLRKQLKGES